MDAQTQHVPLARVLALAASQHGVVTRAQLLALGLDAGGIKYRVRRGRLHVVHRGVYAVGRPTLSRLGVLSAAVLACGPDAALSHESAGEVLGIRPRRPGPVDVTVPGERRARPGIRLHRASLPAGDRCERHGVAATEVVRTLADLALRLSDDALEAAVNAADKLDLIDPERLRAAVEKMPGRRGAARLRRLLDARRFTLTDSQLERRFLEIARRADLPAPETQQHLNGVRVDFFWPDLGLVVETDGLRYHRTPSQQARDRRRDQAHVAAGLVALRFTYAQVAYEPVEVARVLSAAAARPVPTAPRSAPAPA